MTANTAQQADTPRGLPPLPDGWTLTERVESDIHAAGMRLSRAGLCAVGPDGVEVSGSAAETGASATARAWFELLERACLVDAMRDPAARFVNRGADGRPLGIVQASDVFPVSDQPDRWRPARSSGAALGRTFRDAARRAYWELVERDRVLRSWYGERAPARVALGDPSLAGSPAYSWEAYTLPARRGGFGAEVQVAFVVGFPSEPSAPLLRGLGARPRRSSALEVATRECLQGLAFLWGEPIPCEEPALGPTPMAHLDRFLWPGAHGLLREWLDGAHTVFARPAGATGTEPVSFVDLTPRSIRPFGRVVKAICADAEPLVFGEAPAASHLPPERRTHPVA